MARASRKLVEKSLEVTSNWSKSHWKLVGKFPKFGREVTESWPERRQKLARKTSKDSQKVAGRLSEDDRKDDVGRPKS